MDIRRKCGMESNDEVKRSTKRWRRIVEMEETGRRAGRETRRPQRGLRRRSMKRSHN